MFRLREKHGLPGEESYSRAGPKGAAFTFSTSLGADPLSLMLCDSKKSGPSQAKAEGREMEGFPTKCDSSNTQNCWNWLTCSSLSKSSSSYTRISRPGLKPFFDPLPDARPSSIGHTYSSTSSCFFFLRLPKLLKVSFFGLKVKRNLPRS